MERDRLLGGVGRDLLDRLAQRGDLRAPVARGRHGVHAGAERNEVLAQPLRGPLEGGLPASSLLRERVDARAQLMEGVTDLRNGDVRGRRIRRGHLGHRQDVVARRGGGRRGGGTQLLEGRPLVGQRACEVEPAQLPARDEDLAQPLPRLLLQLERVLQLILRDEPPLDEDLADRPLVSGLLRRRLELGPDSGEMQRGKLFRLLLRAQPLVLGPLLGQHAGDVEPRDAEAGDEDLPEALAGRALLLERELELLLGDDPLLDEDLTDQAG